MINGPFLYSMIYGSYDFTSSIALEEDVFVGFGHGAGIYNDFNIFDTDTETWSQVASSLDQGRVAGTHFKYNGKGYVLSGQGQTHGNLPSGANTEMFVFCKFVIATRAFLHS